MTGPGTYDVETVSGRYVNVRSPDPEDICLRDIAHGLSNSCRYGGQSRRFYSVAEHAVMVSYKLQAIGRTDLALVGLHHDDAEAYLGDVQRPLKGLLVDYGELEDRMDAAIIWALGDRWSRKELASPVLKDVDDWACLMEAKQLLPSEGKGWRVTTEQAVTDALATYLGLSPFQAYRAYMHRHMDLIHAGVEWLATA